MLIDPYDSFNRNKYTSKYIRVGGLDLDKSQSSGIAQLYL